ncbi:MAG: ATP-binding protein [Endomicrobiales bacterium]|jgi:signal transduction histidine kinase
MIHKLRIGLPVKFILLISVIIILTSMTLTWYFIRIQEQQMRTTLENRCNFLAQNLAYNSVFSVMTGNKQFLMKLMSGLLTEQDVVYGLVYDTKGRILASATTGVFWKNDFRHTISSMPVSGHLFTEQNEPIFEVTFPIIARHMVGIREEIGFLADVPAESRDDIIGAARVAISLSRMYHESRRLKKVVLVITTGVVFFGIILAGFLIRIIVKPIQQLVLGTKKIAAGNLDYAVNITSGDEIGDLAVSFNQMAQDIKTYVKELSDEKENLLHLKLALEQRTNELEETLLKMQNIQGELLRSEKFATIGKLASSVAHDLRNPLASLKNIAYYLKKSNSCADEKAKYMLELLSMDVVRANKIVTDLLDYSRVKKLYKVPINTLDFFSKLVDSVLFSNKHVNIIRQFDTFEISIDPDRMTQVLINLINNAVDAMEENGVITIVVKKNEPLFTIEIIDTGCGMDEETATHIFEPLFTTKLKGLGLGLAIVKEIIDAHIGTISVHSEMGKGTTFAITLPLK